MKDDLKFEKYLLLRRESNKFLIPNSNWSKLFFFIFNYFICLNIYSYLVIKKISLLFWRRLNPFYFIYLNFWFEKVFRNFFLNFNRAFKIFLKQLWKLHFSWNFSFQNFLHSTNFGIKMILRNQLKITKEFEIALV